MANHYLGPDFGAIAARFDAPGVRAIVLTGSHARGDAGRYSDVDLVRFVARDEESERSVHRLSGRLVTVSDVGPTRVERSFSEPQIAVETIAGLRAARPLIDRDGYFSALQAHAAAFQWDPEMQLKADAWVSREMAGWVEEVYKGLEGLRRNDVGRLLNARFGLSWGLNRVVAVWKGVLLTGDNGFFEEVAAGMGSDGGWVRLRRCAFGVEDEHGVAPRLAEQVRAGLLLFVETAQMLHGVLRPEDAALVGSAVEAVRAAE
jgi:hypothetical protein